MKEKTPLFLLGTGRSGTTLVQRFLNAHSEAMIWGEHIGFLDSVADSYFLLKNHPSMHEYSYGTKVKGTKRCSKDAFKDPKIWQAWMNWFNTEEVDEFYRGFIESIFSPSMIDDCTVWGFKEIRYGENLNVIEFLRSLYPNAVFLCVVRESLNVIESQLNTFHKGTSRYPKLKRITQLPSLLRVAKKWVKMNSTFKRLEKNNNFFFIRYEDFINDYKMINPVLSSLGIEIQKSQIDVFELAEGRGSSFDSNKDVNQRWKDMGPIPAFFSEIMTGATSEELGYPRPSELKFATSLSRVMKFFARKIS